MATDLRDDHELIAAVASAAEEILELAAVHGRGGRPAGRGRR
ncbi:MULTISPECIES: hypothetical protein [Tessaracoccus]|nr:MULTISPECIES: hypothetical protein [Tessaracoccus]VEP40630.1 hypothetical protein TLA_TLA_01881 [Tessaracoccus lapidicaptus]